MTETMISIDKLKNSKVIIFSVLGLVLAGALFWFLFSKTPAATSPGTTGPGSATPGTSAPVPEKIVVPGVNSVTPSDVAKPTSVNPVGVVDSRNFNLTVDRDKVSPDKVIVNLLDLVTINFTAVDKKYDFVQPETGLMWTVEKGETKTVPFQGMSPGQFTFFCVSCGGPDAGPVGYIVVVPKTQ